MKYLLLFLLLILSAPSLLIVFPAPLNVLWRLKIGATELGYILIIPLLIISLLAIYNVNRWIGYIGLFSILLYLLPLVKVVFIAFGLSKELEKAFGKTSKAVSFPINFSEMIGFTSSTNVVEVKTLVYSKGDDYTLDLDLYSDKKHKKHKPCIVSVHGGAWSSGDNRMFVDFNANFASLGYVVADVNYRLAPDYIFPTQEHDIISAIDYLKANALELQIDTNNFFLLGRSAGGQIAAVTAFHLGSSKIKGLICFYTPFDMVWGYSVPGNPLILDSRKVLGDYLGGSFEEAESNFYASSPVHQLTSDAPPILMIHGESDEMVAYEHNLRLISKLKDKPIPYYLLSIPYATHGCDYFFSQRSGQLSSFAIDFFLKRFSKDHFPK